MLLHRDPITHLFIIYFFSPQKAVKKHWLWTILCLNSISESPALISVTQGDLLKVQTPSPSLGSTEGKSLSSGVKQGCYKSEFSASPPDKFYKY